MFNAWAKAFTKVTLGGLLIGKLHSYPTFLAFLLCVYFIIFIIRVYSQKSSVVWSRNKFQLLTGMTVSFLCGFIIEWLGTDLEYWIYQSYPDYFVKFPPWVPVAWALAYKTFFELEQSFINLGPVKKTIAVVLMFVTLAPYGEVVAMNLGTWHYTIYPQFLMMPWQPVVALLLVHIFIRLFTNAIVQRREGYD